MANTFIASRLRQHGHNVQQQCVETALMSATPHATAHVYSKFDFTKPCQKCALQNEHTARKIDRYSRWIFPTTFSIFCVCYWLYFTFRSS
ncbi:hypothetical protein Aduo_015116 [Ancylostoma duodenale]